MECRHTGKENPENFALIRTKPYKGMKQVLIRRKKIILEIKPKTTMKKNNFLLFIIIKQIIRKVSDSGNPDWSISEHNYISTARKAFFIFKYHYKDFISLVCTVLVAPASRKSVHQSQQEKVDYSASFIILFACCSEPDFGILYRSQRITSALIGAFLLYLFSFLYLLSNLL